MVVDKKDDDERVTLTLDKDEAVSLGRWLKGLRLMNATLPTLLDEMGVAFDECFGSRPSKE